MAKVRVVLEFEVEDAGNVLESGNTHQVRLGQDGDGDTVIWLDGCETQDVYVEAMEVV